MSVTDSPLRINKILLFGIIVPGCLLLAPAGWAPFAAADDSLNAFPLAVHSTTPFPVKPEDLTIDPSRSEEILHAIRLQRALEAILRELNLQIELQVDPSVSTNESPSDEASGLEDSEDEASPGLFLEFEVKPDHP